MAVWFCCVFAFFASGLYFGGPAVVVTAIFSSIAIVLCWDYERDFIEVLARQSGFPLGICVNSTSKELRPISRFATHHCLVKSRRGCWYVFCSNDGVELNIWLWLEFGGTRGGVVVW